MKCVGHATAHATVNAAFVCAQSCRSLPMWFVWCSSFQCFNLHGIYKIINRVEELFESKMCGEVMWQFQGHGKVICCDESSNLWWQWLLILSSKCAGTTWNLPFIMGTRSSKFVQEMFCVHILCSGVPLGAWWCEGVVCYLPKIVQCSWVMCVFTVHHALC